MSLPKKSQDKLQAFLTALDSGAVQPEDLTNALEAVMTVIESANRELDQRINKSSENATGALAGLENRVSQATSELQALIRQVKAEETTDKEELRKMVAAELLRIESKIPQIPEQFDATELYNDIQSHKEMLTGLSELIVGENIRNALEALPEGEKLVMEAIEGLPELLEKLSQMEGKGNVVGGVSRALVEQLIKEGGSGSSLPDQTGNSGKFLSTDGTDASWETVSAGSVDVVSNVATDRILGRTTAGTGDSEQLTASEVRTLINVEDDSDKTDTANVTSAGALMDSEVDNLAQVKAFDSTDYAPALGADDNYVTDAEKTVVGNTSGTNTGDEVDMTATVGGLVPTPPNNTTTFLRGDGTFATPPGGGSGGITWNEVTGTTQAASVNAGYIANNAGLVTITIPTTAAVGDVVRVTGKGAGGWLIAQNASEIIHFLGSDTTTGTGGSLASTGTYDGVEIVCVVANTEWVVISSMGNITIV